MYACQITFDYFESMWLYYKTGMWKLVYIHINMAVPPYYPVNTATLLVQFKQNAGEQSSRPATFFFTTGAIITKGYLANRE